jgi:hypothetical protein
MLNATPDLVTFFKRASGMLGSNRESLRSVDELLLRFANSGRDHRFKRADELMNPLILKRFNRRIVQNV